MAKPLYLSKTIFAKIILICLAILYRPLYVWIQETPEAYFAIDFLITCVMRIITKEPVTMRKKDAGLSILLMLIFSIFILTGCQTGTTEENSSSSVPHVVAKSEFYRHDLNVSINGAEFIGVGVVPHEPKYEVQVTTEDSIDRIQWRTCNRQEVVDRKPKGFWSNIFGGNSGDSFNFTFDPVDKLEDLRACPLKIEVLTQRKTRVGFALIDFTDSRAEFSIKTLIKCNGAALSARGVGVCQSAGGLMQEIRFDRPVIPGSPDPGCEKMISEDVNRQVYRFQISTGQCLYLFGGQDGSRFRLTTVGYNEVPYRE